MRRPLFFVLVLHGLSLAGAAPAGDIEAGRHLVGMCGTCHGVDGYARIPIAPHIGGEPADYLEAQLTAFKTGARKHEMMNIVARGLSARQIKDVSAWYAAHEVTAELPDGMVEDDAPAACVSCHGADGISELPDTPNLAGEAGVYIDAQLKAFKRGKRGNEIMNGVAAEMTDGEIRAAADWYGAIRLMIKPLD